MAMQCQLLAEQLYQVVVKRKCMDGWEYLFSLPSLFLFHQTISFLLTCFLLSNKTIVLSDNYIRYSPRYLHILQCIHAIITQNSKWVERHWILEVM